jgi:hypothetical protein
MVDAIEFVAARSEQDRQVLIIGCGVQLDMKNTNPDRD